MAKASGTTRKGSPVNSKGLADNNASSFSGASGKLYQAIREFDEKGYITTPPINVGKADSVIKAYAVEIGNPLESDDLYFTGSGIIHALRDTKEEAGIRVADEDFTAFPYSKRSMEIYYDKETGNYTYTDKVNKYIVRPNERIKIGNNREKVVSLVTASKLRENGYTEFNMTKYIKLK